VFEGVTTTTGLMNQITNDVYLKYKVLYMIFQLHNFQKNREIFLD
jgi:hypothetical protein